MKFNLTGPDIPIELIRALEDDNLVFFCGAGISQVSDKPEFSSFENLLNKVLNTLNYKEDLKRLLNIEDAFDKLNEEFKYKNIDTCIRQLLTLEDNYDKHLIYHEVLFKLSTSISRLSPRVVTTNFDNCFDLVKDRQELRSGIYTEHYANALPVPDKEWSSIVYLHGKVTVPHSELIYSSTSFAKAYIGNQWAANFLRQLFQNYTVVFIGYSMNDPIMKYVIRTIDPNKRPYILLKETTNLNLDLKKISFKTVDGLWSTLTQWSNLHQGGSNSWISYAKAELINAYPVNPDLETINTIEVNNMIQILSDTNKAKILIGSLPIAWLNVFRKIDEDLTLKSKYFNVLQPFCDQEGPLYGKVVNSFEDNRLLHPISLNIGKWIAKNFDSDCSINYLLDNHCIIHPDLFTSFEDEYKELCVKSKLNSIQKHVRELILYYTESGLDFRKSFVKYNHFDFSDDFHISSSKEKLLRYLRPYLSIIREEVPSPSMDCLSNYVNIKLRLRYSYIEEGFLQKLRNFQPVFLKSLLRSLNNYVYKVIELSSLYQSEDSLSRDLNYAIASDTDKKAHWVNLIKWLVMSLELNELSVQEEIINAWSNSNTLILRRLAAKQQLKKLMVGNT